MARKRRAPEVPYSSGAAHVEHVCGSKLSAGGISTFALSFGCCTVVGATGSANKDLGRGMLFENAKSEEKKSAENSDVSRKLATADTDTL